MHNRVKRQFAREFSHHVSTQPSSARGVASPEHRAITAHDRETQAAFASSSPYASGAWPSRSAHCSAS